MEKEQTEVKKSKKGAIIKIIVGSVLMLAGVFCGVQSSVFRSAIIEAGAATTVEGILEADPNSRQCLIKISEVMEAAIQARTVSSEQLSKIISSTINDFGLNIDTRLLIQVSLDKILFNYAVSDTEQEYIDRLNCVLNALKLVVSQGCDADMGV